MHSTARTASSVHLDAIRGLAAMVVFLAHGRNLFFGSSQAGPLIHVAAAQQVVAVPSTPESPAGLGMGHYAVIVFFVLSGYLVGSSVLKVLAGRHWSWSRYLTRRLTRLWVVLLPAVAIGFCWDRAGVLRFGPGTLYGAPFGQSVVQHPVIERLSASIAIRNAAFLQTITAPELGTNVALWSLANEFWYYVLFPLLVIALWRGANGRLRIVSAAAAVLLTWFVGPSIAEYFLIWLLGVAVWRLPALEPRVSRPLGAGFGLAFLLGSLYVRHHLIGTQFQSDFGLAVLFCGFLYAALQERREMRPNWYAYSAHHLASASYTIYLVHLPALIFLNAELSGAWRPWPKDAVHLAAFAAISIAVLAYAFVVYLLFERNTDRVRKALESLRRPAKSSREAYA